MDILLPNDEKYVKYIGNNSVLYKNQKGTVKDVPSEIKENDLIWVKITKVSPSSGFESTFLRKFTRDRKKRSRDFSKSDRKSSENKEDKDKNVHENSDFKLLNEITEDLVGKTVFVRGKVIEIKQTKGPTLFILYDGSRTSVAKGFVKPGERSFPEINIGDRISAKVQISVFDGGVELLIKKFNFLSKAEDEALIKKIELETERKTKVNDWDFLIDSEILKKLKPEFEFFAKTINKAIVENRQILLKHHADCDGFSSAIAIERAIISKLIDHHGADSALWKFYKRAPSKSPYYDYYDASRDTAFFMEDVNKFGAKEPLIIILDFGSSTESLMSYQKLKNYGAHIIILDHHPIDEKEKQILSDYVDVIVNPHLVGSEYEFSAGMLSVEASHFLSNEVDVDYIAALAGIGDRVEGKEMDAYLEIAEKKGYSKEYLIKMARAIDFEAYNLKFTEARDYYDDLFTLSDRQKNMVETICNELDRREKLLLKTIDHVKNIKTKDNKSLVLLDLQNNFLRDYPTAGRIVGLAHDNLKESTEELVTIGYDYDLVIVRVKDNSNFDVRELIESLLEKFPWAQVNGGGHKHAGSIKFIPSVLEKVLLEIENMFFNN